jgi:hypothetical protein
MLAAAAIAASAACGAPDRLPDTLSDRDFWRLIETLSEPPGTFPLSDNMVSNEPRFAETARWLRASGGVYVGVGPEQNFSYIAALQPAMAFIIDIRRENLDLHLLYKVLFETSGDRVEFVSRLFSRPRPAGIGGGASVDAIFAALDGEPPSAAQYASTTAMVRERLLGGHRLPLLPEDLETIERALGAFYTSGPAIDYYGSRPFDAVRPSYRQLMTAKDFNGVSRSFLGSDEQFQVVKGLHAKNLIVPVVGDFAGSTAMRRVGEYVRERGQRIQVVYGSNVGVYLSNQQTRAFCANLASLPLALNGWFVDSVGMRSLQAKLEGCQGAGK